MSGRLFSENFLNEEIKHTNDWKSITENASAFNSFQEQLGVRLANIQSNHLNANETTTKVLLINPILESLGWNNLLQETHSGYGIPDQLLFLDENSMNLASTAHPIAKAFRYATVIQESKKFGIELSNSLKAASPHAQILDYLRIAEFQTDGNLRWGMLTNGRVWRLYDRKTIPRLDAYYEVDLISALSNPNTDLLKRFYLLFRKEAFRCQEGERQYFLEQAIAHGRTYEEKVTKTLAEKIYGNVFPKFINLLALNSEASLGECRDNALVLLYRLLFLLFAEDRGFLPITDQAYQGYGLRSIRDEIDEKIDQATWSSRLTKYYDHVLSLCRLIDEGDDELGVPPYNGGLFADERAPLLNIIRLPDSEFAPAIFELSHLRDHDGRTQYISYRDLSVQQLGSIYEQLLEKEPVVSHDGTIEIQFNPYVRKDSGSYYTPQELVDVVLEHTLTPLIDEKRNAFREKVAAVLDSDYSSEERLRQLQTVDPASAVLNLKVLDPAMGSGHFLVSAVDLITDHISSCMSFPDTLANDWLESNYQSPLIQEIEETRNAILNRANRRNWDISDSQLSDKNIISRMVLKKCIYGVDKNALAVELAKVSLWLHTFTIGTPLSFLDHHLRQGDSLIGMTWESFIKDYQRLASNLVFDINVRGLEQQATTFMQQIESLVDSDLDEVHQSSKIFHEVETLLAPLHKRYDMLCGWRWITAGMRQGERKSYEKELKHAIDHATSSQFLAGDPTVDLKLDPKLKTKWLNALIVAEQESFFHWEIAFPGVWRNIEGNSKQGGFDAIIGNPPWDVAKVEETEWFALRNPEIARLQKTQRKQAIGTLKKSNDPLITSFEEAKRNSQKFSNYVRKLGEYPLLSFGDFNLYGLFVERSLSLLNSGGIVGLLTPSGIFSDRPSSKFFKIHSTRGRVGSIYDFENRRPGTNKGSFFPNVHPQFRFCVLVIGGTARRFQYTECGFLLHSPTQIKEENRCVKLTAEDFKKVNPNTGTAPTFLNGREAQIITSVHNKHPVLVNHSNGEISAMYDIKYLRMFDSSNDSNCFTPQTTLEREGYYPIRFRRWKKGKELIYPLYQARMIHQYDHRRSSIGFNPDNLHRPHVSLEVSEEEHRDPNFFARPFHYVSAQIAIQKSGGVLKDLDYLLGCRRISSSTNARTIIASIVPQAGYVDSMWLLIPEVDKSSSRDSAINNYKKALPFLVSVFNSFVCDFFVRRKLQSVALNWYIMEQLPVIRPEDYEKQFGNSSAIEVVQRTVLELTYTASDMEPYARDQGFGGTPFVWDSERRRHLKARLDALYFHLYGITRKDAAYILDTFSIVKNHDLREFGHYRTKDMILAYMNALSAGDGETIVDV